MTLPLETRQMIAHDEFLTERIVKLSNERDELLKLLSDLAYAAWRFHDDTGHNNGGVLQCDWICEAMSPAKAFLEERGAWPSAVPQVADEEGS